MDIKSMTLADVLLMAVAGHIAEARKLMAMVEEMGDGGLAPVTESEGWVRSNTTAAQAPPVKLPPAPIRAKAVKSTPPPPPAPTPTPNRRSEAQKARWAKEAKRRKAAERAGASFEVQVAPPPAPAPASKPKRRKWSRAMRKAAADRMRQRWANRKVA